jgi:hypothetical protein
MIYPVTVEFVGPHSRLLVLSVGNHSAGVKKLRRKVCQLRDSGHGPE